jgi:hypothetical protein
MPFEAQDLLSVRNMVIAPNKQITFGTQLADGNLTHRLRHDPGLFAAITKAYRGDGDRAGKGHPFPTERQVIEQDTGVSGTVEVTDFLMGWLLAMVMGKDVTTGSGPYTHTFSWDQTTNIAPATTVYFEDTADVKYKMQDLSMVDLTIAGAEKGPLTAQFSMVGSGRYTDGAMGSLPSLPTNVYMLGSDTDILIGPQGSAASIKERVRSWQIKVTSGIVNHRAPGGGMFATMNKIVNPPRATCSLVVAAKDTDDMRTLFLGDTLRELQINTVSSAKTLNLKFPACYFSAAQLGGDGNEAVWHIEIDEMAALQQTTVQPLVAVAINTVAASYLVAA